MHTICEVAFFYIHSKSNAISKDYPLDIKLPAGFFVFRESSSKSEVIEGNKELEKTLAAISDSSMCSLEVSLLTSTKIVSRKRKVDAVNNNKSNNSLEDDGDDDVNNENDEKSAGNLDDDDSENDDIPLANLKKENENHKLRETSTLSSSANSLANSPSTAKSTAKEIQKDTKNKNYLSAPSNKKLKLATTEESSSTSKPLKSILKSRTNSISSDNSSTLVPTRAKRTLRNRQKEADSDAEDTEAEPALRFLNKEEIEQASKEKCNSSIRIEKLKPDDKKATNESTTTTKKTRASTRLQTTTATHSPKTKKSETSTSNKKSDSNELNEEQPTDTTTKVNNAKKTTKQTNSTLNRSETLETSYSTRLR